MYSKIFERQAFLKRKLYGPPCDPNKLGSAFNPFPAKCYPDHTNAERNGILSALGCYTIGISMTHLIIPDTTHKLFWILTNDWYVPLGAAAFFIFIYVDSKKWGPQPQTSSEKYNDAFYFFLTLFLLITFLCYTNPDFEIYQEKILRE